MNADQIADLKQEISDDESNCNCEVLAQFEVDHIQSDAEYQQANRDDNTNNTKNPVASNLLVVSLEMIENQNGIVEYLFRSYILHSL